MSSRYQESYLFSRRKKDKADLSSYCPVNNLNPLAKCLVEMLKKQFDEFFDSHNVIPNYHHGSQKGNNTTTAAMALQNLLHDNQDKSMYSAVMLSDLSSTFDTCNHEILTLKVKNIGMRGKALSIMKSYLKERKTFVEVQGYSSKIRYLGDKSVVQGSKMAS